MGRDAAYLALAQNLDEPFMTGDESLYRAIHAPLDWVRWLADYSDQE